MAMRTARRFFQTGGFGGGDGEPPAVMFTATTTTSPQTLTLQSIGVAAGEEVVVDWGDGSENTYSGTAQRTHQYATAGTYTVRILSPEHLRAIDLRDNKITLDSANLRVASGLTAVQLQTLRAGTIIHSNDFADMPLTDFRIGSMPAGTYTINSADLAGKVLTGFLLSSMAAGTYNINSNNFTSASLTFIQIANMPAGTYEFNTADFVGMPIGTFQITNSPTVWTINAADLAGLTTPTTYRVDNNNLNQTQVDALLDGLYRAAVAPRTAAGGTINVGGNNAAPSGTLEQPANCADTGTWSGKNFAHELRFDDCEAGFNVWATVTITA